MCVFIGYSYINQGERCDTYEMSQSGIRPKYTLGRNPFSGLSQVHSNDRTEEIFDLVAV